MVERTTAAGAPYGPSERVSVEEALVAYTRHAAYAAGVEDRVGTLAPRRLADLVVLDADPTTVTTGDIAAIGVQATLVAGRPTHDRDGAFHDPGR